MYKIFTICLLLASVFSTFIYPQRIKGPPIVVDVYGEKLTLYSEDGAQFDANSNLTIGICVTNSYYRNHTILSNTWIDFFTNGVLAKYYPAESTVLQGIPVLKGKYTSFYPTGQLQCAALSKPFTFQLHNSSLTLPSNSVFSLSESNRLIQIWECDTNILRDGWVYNGERGLHLFENGSVSSGYLAVRRCVGKLNIPESAQIDFFPSGAIQAIYAYEPFGSPIQTFLFDGKPYCEAQFDETGQILELIP